MFNPQVVADQLSALLATESRGLLQHLDQTQLYLTPQTYPVWQDLRRLAQVGITHAQRVTSLAQSLELELEPVSYPCNVAQYHYLTLDQLLPHLIDEKRQQVAAYQRAVGAVQDERAAARELQTLLEENQAHVSKLEAAYQSLSSVSAAPSGS